MLPYGCTTAVKKKWITPKETCKAEWFVLNFENDLLNKDVKKAICLAVFV